MPSSPLTFLDYLAIAAYLIAVAAIGYTVSKQGARTTKKYFIADRNMPHWAVAFTLMATLISSNTLVAHPGIVFKNSMVLVPGFLVLPIVLVLIAKFVVPFYRRVIGLSAYEYIEKRFGLESRMYSSFGFLIDRIFDIGVTLMTTALVVNVIAPQWPVAYVLFGLGIFTLLYTMIGGIAAVVWTDVLQGVILIGGGLLIFLYLLFTPAAGAPFSTLTHAWEAGKFSFGSTELTWASLFDTENRTVWMFMIAMAIIWTRKYVSDQNMVQRYLLARTDQEARRAALLGAALSVPILIGFNLIGAALFGFYELSGATPPDVADKVLPHFIVTQLPNGIVGLIVAAILAASMSSVSSDLNSVGTVVTSDYFQRFLPRSADRTRLLVGRTTVLIAGLLAAAIGVWLIPSETSESTASRVLAYATILSAGTLGLFSLGFLTKRATRQGAFAGIVACLLFTTWGTLTHGNSPIVDLGPFNWQMNFILLGVFGHFVLFGVGYLYSLLFGGYRPAGVEQLVVGAEVPDEEIAEPAYATGQQKNGDL
ncbi:sodium:solute symporter family transporter [Pelagicoccus mobilis]|uniref:Sodium/solute symporter n=1 Tax=Pelagicoccus mobilis TaxID=415221 RepID=A0A934VT42_9BACT|nr:sodium/solute symporter [Pelagicoccus mobilis]MBK1879680.1 sodium/solute symporter [Pelagicoccus mobilis]